LDESGILPGLFARVEIIIDHPRARAQRTTAAVQQAVIIEVQIHPGFRVELQIQTEVADP
jgi:hypothetical protein